MAETVILSAARTPVGSFQGGLSQIPAPRLGSYAIGAAVQRAGLTGSEIHECIMGQVLTAGAGQAPARQAALFAALPHSVHCMTINKVCGSGLKAVMLGSDSIQCGHSELVVAGGQENMSLAPHLLENSRMGFRLGDVKVTDSMIKDGLWDPYHQFHMGSAAELCASEYSISREMQDAFAIESYKKAIKAQSDHLFRDEIVDVEDSRNKIFIQQDEEPGRAKFDKVVTLKPAFEKTGTITAANASKINDGAAAVVLTSQQYAQRNQKKPLAKIIATASFAQDPKWFTTAPVGAIKEVLKKAQLQTQHIDLWEINEAFSVVALAAIKELNLSENIINVHGGAVAIGHPIGASGARILTTLLYALRTHKKKKGLATLCIGGGEAVAVVVELL